MADSPVEQLLYEALTNCKVPFIPQFDVHECWSRGRRLLTPHSSSCSYWPICRVPKYRLDCLIIVDLQYGSTLYLAVETDGRSFHQDEDRRVADFERERWLKRYGFDLLRFAAVEILRRKYWHVSEIIEYVQAHKPLSGALWEKRRRLAMAKHQAVVVAGGATEEAVPVGLSRLKPFRI